MADMAANSSKNAVKAVFVPSTTYYLSLHTATPGTTGANEASGGSYVRKAFKMGTPASTGKQTCTTPTTITVKAPNATHKFPYVGAWTASSGGTFVWGGASGLGTTTITATSTVLFAKANVTAKIT